MSATLFRAAIEARDIDAAVALCRDDVVFRSPIVFSPYHGRAALRTILDAVIEVFEDFRYTREIGASGDHVLVFEARVADKRVEGADFLYLDHDGLISEFAVMVRPLSGALALADAMKARLARASG